jgi:hypothetical protein
MNRRYALMVVLWLSVVASARAQEPRAWTDDPGGFRVEAEFLAFAGDRVNLRRTDGREIAVPIARLSESDKTFLRRHALAAEAGFLMTDADYDDFEIKLQFRLSAGAGSGLFFRTDPNATANAPANRSGQVEVQLIDDDHFPKLPEMSKTGSIYGIFPRKVVPLVKKGDWNDLRVRLEKRKIQIWINDVQTSTTPALNSTVSPA